MRYRKRPVVIEAVPVADALRSAGEAWGDLPSWLFDAYDESVVVFASDAVLIYTPEGQMRGEVGDWIIKDVQDELYLCKPDVFAATYEEVSPPHMSVVQGREMIRALAAAGVIAHDAHEVTIWVRRGEPVEVGSETPLPRSALQPIVDHLTA